MKKYITISIVVFAILAVFLRQVFGGAIILPQFFHFGIFTIHYYGLIIALAATAGFLLAIRRASVFGILPKQAEDLLFWTIIGGFIGARLYHVLSSADYYWQHPLDILKVWNGGLSIYGAIFGGIFILWFLPKILNLKSSILNFLDWLVPSVVLGQIIGRFGNLFNYEAFGYPTNLPWKMFVPAQFRPEIFTSAVFFHPWFLYEALGNVFILIFLLKMGKNKKAGMVAFLYLLLYNLLRFCLEFLRTDSTFIGAYRLNSLVSLTLIIVGAYSLFHLRRHVSKA